MPSPTLPPDVEVASAVVRAVPAGTGGSRAFYPAVIITVENGGSSLVRLFTDQPYTLVDRSGAAVSPESFTSPVALELAPGKSTEYVDVPANPLAGWQPSRTPLHVMFRPDSIRATTRVAPRCTPVWITQFWVVVLVEDARGKTMAGDVGEPPLSLDDTFWIPPDAPATFDGAAACTTIPSGALQGAQVKVIAYGYPN